MRFYDQMNRLVQLIEAANSTQERRTAYTYNSKGQQESLTKPDGSIIFSSYDSLGRLASVKDQHQTFHYSYRYNAKGLPTHVRDHVHAMTTIRRYDPLGRLILEKLQTGWLISYVYDGMNRPLRVGLPDGSAIAYAYKGPYLSQVSRLDSQDSIIYQHAYTKRDLSGNPIEEKLAGHAGDFLHQYDHLGRIKRIHHSKWKEDEIVYRGTEALIYRKVTDALGVIPCHYTYDDLNQIKEEQGQCNHRYAYDSLYNRLAKDEKSCVIGDCHQLLQQGNVTYTYDRNGNRLEKLGGEDQIHYTYDALDRLISVQHGKQKTAYLYDAFNRRLAKIVNGKICYYFYADQNELGAMENQRIIELRLLGTGKGAEIGAAVALEIDQKPYVPLHDHNGHVTTLLDLQGQVVEVYRYSAYGEEEIYDGNGHHLEKAINPWRFSSKRHDAETGFIYFGRRYYDPDIGRWITPDPLGPEGGPNLYAYAVNNPFSRIDLYGLTDMGEFFYGCWDQMCNVIGTTLYTFGHEVIPIPLFKDAFMLAGYVIQGGSVNTYTVSWHQTNSYAGFVGDWDDPLVKDIFVNGIKTDREQAIKRYEMVSEICNNKLINYLYSATHGLITDTLEWFGLRLGIPTHSVRELVKTIRESIEQVGGLGNGGKIRLKAHSRGGALVDAASRFLTKAELAMIEVITYGSASLFETGDFASVTHHVSNRDWVPLIASPIQYFKACFAESSNVNFLECIGNPFFDHSFEGKTYWNQFNKDIAHIR